MLWSFGTASPESSGRRAISNVPSTIPDQSALSIDQLHTQRIRKNAAISAIEVFGFIAAFLVGMIGYGASIVFAKEIQSMMADNLPWLQ